MINIWVITVALSPGIYKVIYLYGGWIGLI